MIIFLSPAKTFSKSITSCNQMPIFYKDALLIANKIKRISISNLAQQMHISVNLAKETKAYYQAFGTNQTCAIYAYDGYAFKGFDIGSIDKQMLPYLNDHLYILSGLFGLVKPLDCISPYRLDIKDKTIKNLYAFWQPKIYHYLNENHKDQLLINLASGEYSQVLDQRLNFITISFYQIVNGEYRSISMHVKFMRGRMANYLLTHKIDHTDQIRLITLDGYTYDPSKSDLSTISFSKEVIL